MSFWTKFNISIFTVTCWASIDCAYADIKPGNLTNEPGPAGELTLGCVVKGDAVTVYTLNSSKPPMAEESALAGFPNGFDKRTLRLHYEITPGDSFIVRQMLEISQRQVLKGFLIDGKGRVFPGPFYVYPQEWDCSLHINPHN